MRDPAQFLEQLFGLFDIMHHQQGWPAPSEWWQETLTEAERSGTRQRVIRKGRRIGASTIIAPVVAVAEALHGEHAVPPNDVGYFLFFSVKKPEALKRLRGIAKVLDALRVRYRENGDEIALLEHPVAFKVQAASFRTAVGDTSIGIWCDELSRWMDNESGANPAKEVLASVRPTIATMPNAKIWLVSSPLGKEDAHAVAFDDGDNAGQRVYYCPTWVGNPTLSEQDTRDLEPDERVWLREWKGLPQAARLAAFRVEHVERAFVPRKPTFPPAIKVLILDPSSGGHSSRDRFTFAVASWCVDTLDALPPHEVYPMDAQGRILEHPWGQRITRPEFANWQPRGKPYLRFHEVDAFEGGFAGTVSGDDIADKLAAVAKRHDVIAAHSDQRESLFLCSALSQRGITMHAHNWTGPSKEAAVALVRRWLADGSLSLPADALELKRELLSFEEVISKSGALTYGARGSGKDDFAALIVTTAHAELSDNPLARSPHTPEYQYQPVPPEFNAF